MRGTGGPESRFARPGVSCGFRRMTARLRDSVSQGGYPMSQRCDRTGTGEVEEASVLVLLDLGGAFEAGEDDGRGLRLGEGGMLEGVRP